MIGFRKSRVHHFPRSLPVSKQPYKFNMDVAYGGLERFDILAMADASHEQWFNQSLCRVNDCVIRLGIVRGEFHWHSLKD